MLCEQTFDLDCLFECRFCRSILQDYRRLARIATCEDSADSFAYHARFAPLTRSPPMNLKVTRDDVK